MSPTADDTTVGAKAAPACDPTTAYPKPPLPPQSQAAPGLIGAMEPRPDHGESSYRGSGRLAGRRALITGGDSGIGRAVAIAFAREGADVAIGYLPEEEPDAREVVALILAAGRTAVALPGDIRDADVCARLVSDAVAGLGGLDILVNNAATQRFRLSILDLSDEELDSILKTNVYALYRITRAAMPHLGPGATIINTTSRQAYDPSPEHLVYAPTKAAIVTFTKALSKQVAAQGIRVNAVAPGPFWTPLQVSTGTPPEQIPQLGVETSLGRIGQPAEIAALYVHLASAESSYATGQVMGASGGGGLP